MDQKTSGGLKGYDLEKKVGFLERMKYVALPAAIAIGAYFTPEIRKKYSDLPDETKTKYKTATFIGTGLFGTAITIVSGYKLFKNSKQKNQKDSYDNSQQ